MPADFDTVYRFIFFACLLALFVLERVGAFQQRPAPGTHRWASNVALFLIGGIVGALVLPAGLFAFAESHASGWVAGLPLMAQVALGFLVVDLWKYGEHRLFHGVPLLWRLHLVHHSDTALDVTTSERHHPVEVAVSMVLMIALVAWLGLPPLALAVYLVTATVVALYSHANVRFPAAADRALARVLVTPRVHAVHHSNVRAETDSNFGSVLTLWDRLFGTYVEPARARVPHIGLDYFHHAADTRWWRVLLQPFLYAPRHAYPPRGAHRAQAAQAPRSRAPAAPFAASRGARMVLLIGLAACALVLATLWPTVADMTRIWRDTEAWQYAWLVLPMLVYLLAWHRGAAWTPVDPLPGLAGVIVAGIAALLFAAASLVNVDAGRQLALVLMLQGVALAALGWRAYVRLFPVLALLFFAVPYGDVLVPLLRRLTLESIVLVTTLAGVPHTIDGYVVLVGARRYIVVDECAGLAYVTLAAFLGYCFALLMHRSLARAAGMALAGALLGVVSNVIRVNAIVLIDWMRGSQMDLTAHGTAQWIMLLAVLGALMVMLARSRVLDERPAACDVTRRHAAWLLWSPALAAAMAPMTAGMLAALAMHERMPVSALAAGAFPADLSGWTRLAPPQRTELAASTRAQMMHASYGQDARTLELSVVEALDQDAKLPDSALAPGGHAVWREKQVNSETACAAADCIAVRHATWQRESSPEVRHVYLVYGVGAFTTDSRLAARMAQGWRRLHGDDRTPRVVAISTDVPLSADELARAMRDVRAAMAGAAGLQVAGAR